MANGYWVAQQKLNSYKKLWCNRFGNIPETSGIYILTRQDENGFRFAYVGQAKHILTRLAQHSVGFTQHIDRSLKTHKVWKADNPYGWQVKWVECAESDLDRLEKETTLNYSNLGYQLRNKTTGSQGNDKSGIDNNNGGLGYRKGVAYGYEKCRKEITELFDKYLDFSIKSTCIKKNGEFTEIGKKKFNEFSEMLKGGNNGQQD